MASDGIDCEILKRAAKVVGGVDNLAQHLDVRADQIHQWIQGKENARGGLYLIAIDILSRNISTNPKKAPRGSSLSGL